MPTLLNIARLLNGKNPFNYYFMKLILVVTLMIASVSFSQENPNGNKQLKNNTYPPNQPAQDSLKMVQFHNDSVNYEIELVNSHLNSIQIKWDWIMNNPEEKVIAEEQGWFVKMTAVREELEQKKLSLTNSLK